MTSRRLFVAALLIAACALAWSRTLDAQAIQRVMYVSALNDAGAPVPDLGPSDFVVREDNIAREVLKVEPAAAAMQIAILVDTSQAARDDVPHIRTALPAFVATLTGAEPKNEVALIAIGERPTVFTNYTFSQTELKKGIDRIWSMQGSGAYLLDGIIETCQGFKKRSAQRPVIVAILSEGPEFSNRQHDQVLDPLRATGAAFHAITMGRPSASTSDEARNRNLVLDEGPRLTGGRREELLTPMALDAKLKLLAGAHPSVQGHLRPSAVADSTGESHGLRRQAGHDGAGDADQGRQGKEVSGTADRLERWVRATGGALRSFIRVEAALSLTPLIVSLAVALVRGQAPQPPQVPFRSAVDLVSLNVTVTDGTAKYITDLTAEDFNVFEDGVKQEVTFFNRTNLPIALALLLDTSASMDSKLPTAQEAAIGFARKLRAQDLAEVIDFDSRVIVLQNFTNSASELETAIRKTSAGGSTSLYNAVYIALKDLKKVVAKNSDEIRRQAIVVLSDGEDTSSLLPFEEVLDLAKRSETAIYAIGLRAPDGPGTTTKGFKEAEFVLRQFAQETGARSFFPTQLADLAGIYGMISDELSSQYTVGYTSRNPKRDGSWRRVVVRVARPNLTSRTKLGYFAPTPPH